MQKMKSEYRKHYRQNTENIRVRIQNTVRIQKTLRVGIQKTLKVRIQKQLR